MDHKMEKGKVKDITLEILVSIRDEIKALRKDTNERFVEVDNDIKALREDTNKRFGEVWDELKRLREDISEMKQDIKAIVGRFNGDYIWNFH